MKKEDKPRTFSDIQGLRKIMSHAYFPRRPLNNVFHKSKNIKTQDPGREVKGIFNSLMKCDHRKRVWSRSCGAGQKTPTDINSSKGKT